MKKALMIVVLAVLFVSSAALADSVTITWETIFSDPSFGSITSSNSYGFKGTQTITFSFAGKTCNLKGSSGRGVAMGCNYTLGLAPDGKITGKLTSGDQDCTQ